MFTSRIAVAAALLLVTQSPAEAQGTLPAPGLMPAPAAATSGPYTPTPLMQGGVVVPLYPPGSPRLNATKVSTPEIYELSTSTPGRVNTVVSVHNPSIEIHTVGGTSNTGAAIILVPGGGHKKLVIATEGTDLVPFFFNLGVHTVILRYRLRADGYEPTTDAVTDALQAIRIVRANAKTLGIDPNKIGIMGFSAGAELSAPSAVAFEAFDKQKVAGDPLGNISARPDFVGVIYPGPSPFTKAPNTPIPLNVPPSFIMSPGSGDRIHALWATDYFTAMLKLGVPNLEMHIYGNGFHPGSGSTGGITDREGTPLGTWHHRFVDWFRDLGFLQKPGVPTKAARDTEAFVKQQQQQQQKGANPEEKRAGR